MKSLTREQVDAFRRDVYRGVMLDGRMVDGVADLIWPDVKFFHEGNGCLTVVSGSHRGPMLSLCDGERFAGAVAADAEKQAPARSLPSEQAAE